MSDTIIVATFDNTSSAYDAASAIKKLMDEKVVDFKPKAGVMVKKDDLGNVSLLENKDRPLFGTAVGTAVGALVGLIGGPATHHLIYTAAEFQGRRSVIPLL
jgi:uncharacterized membrane protein